MIKGTICVDFSLESMNKLKAVMDRWEGKVDLYIYAAELLEKAIDDIYNEFILDH